jgi:flagellin
VLRIYQAQMDVLMTIKNKTVQSADSSLNDAQRTAIRNQVADLLNELDDIATQAKWNGDDMFGETFTFHVGSDANDSLSIALNDSTSDAVGGVTDLSSSDGCFDDHKE